MINAVIYYDNIPGVKSSSGDEGSAAGGSIRGYIIEGHAGTAEAGHDLVCAGVSTLAQTALLGLDAYLGKKPIWKINETGFMECRLPEGLTGEDLEKAQVILTTMELGLISIAKNYGHCLKVSRRRWTKC